MTETAGRALIPCFSPEAHSLVVLPIYHWMDADHFFARFLS